MLKYHDYGYLRDGRNSDMGTFTTNNYNLDCENDITHVNVFIVT